MFTLSSFALPFAPAARARFANRPRWAALVASVALLGAAGPALAGDDGRSGYVGNKVHPGAEKIRIVRDVDVEIWTNKGHGARYCVGEEIDIFFRTNADAWVVILDTDTRGRTHRIFPNRYDREHFVRAGRTYRLPVDGYRFEVDGPPGHETLTAVASTNRRDLRRAVDDLLDGSRYPARHRYGDRSGVYYDGDYEDRDYDDRDYDDRRYDDRDYDDRRYGKGGYAEKLVVVPDEVAIDHISHRVRDGRRCHARPYPRRWW